MVNLEQEIRELFSVRSVQDCDKDYFKEIVKTTFTEMTSEDKVKLKKLVNEAKGFNSTYISDDIWDSIYKYLDTESDVDKKTYIVKIWEVRDSIYSPIDEEQLIYEYLTITCIQDYVVLNSLVWRELWTI